MLLEKYTPIWVEKFEAIKKEIERALGEHSYRIEHVGSTAVQDLDAKPIIDIDIVYTVQEDFEFIKLGLERIGYYHNGNQGIDDREVFKRNGFICNDILDNVTHHLYVCSGTSKALERHLLSRDYMRQNEWARLQYQQLKYEMAEKASQDRKVYQLLKEQHINAFIDVIVDKQRAIQVEESGWKSNTAN